MTELSEKRKRIVFAAGFGVLMLLSMDIWNWASAEPLILGMPFWIVWDILLVLAAGFYFLLFTMYLWRD